MSCSLVQRLQLQEFYIRNFNKIVENEDFCNSDKQWLQLRLLLIAENRTPMNMPISHKSLLTKKRGTTEPLILRQVYDFFYRALKVAFSIYDLEHFL